MEIEVAVLDENDPAKTHTLTPFRAPISLIRELNWEGLETAANIDWLRPPYGKTYVPFTPDQIITGSQHYVAPIGDGMNSDLTISHNLGTRALHVTVRQNSGTRAIVEPLAITLDSENDLSITFAEAPATNGYVVVIYTAGPVSAFQAHGHTIAQIEGLQLILDDLGGRVETLESIVTHPFGVAVRSDAESTLTATASIYGRVQSVTPAAASAFALRARLLNFDTEDRASARGLISLAMEETKALITSL